MTMRRLPFLFALLAALIACEETGNPAPVNAVRSGWVRHAGNPVYRDSIPAENYEAAGDPHVFSDDTGQLWMIYSGDIDGRIGIKLAKGRSWYDWEYVSPLLYQTGPSGLDSSKETAFYRMSSTGKHQIYYIGYPDETTYESQIYLAESDSLEGPYQQQATPIVSRGMIAGRQVALMTSPSVVAHEGMLYLSFLAWDDFANVTQVWVLGATSTDEGHTWTSFAEVNVPVGMEGQITRAPDGSFVAVNTADYHGTEAIYYSTSAHPFGPWEQDTVPILIKADDAYEKDEIIAPQVTFCPSSGTPYLYYTGADHMRGWWIMLATWN